MLNSGYALEIYLIVLTITTYLPFTRGNADQYNNKAADLSSSEDIDSVCNTLRTLDKSLKKLFESPPVDGGNELMKQMRNYNRACSTLLSYCHKDQARAFSVAEDMLERGGPEFLDVDIDDKLMMQKFSWDGKAMIEMQQGRKQTNIIWYDLWRLYNKVPLSAR